MKSSPDNMRDEKVNQDVGLDEAMAGEVGAVPHLTRQVLWKMDIRHEYSNLTLENY